MSRLDHSLLAAGLLLIAGGILIGLGLTDLLDSLRGEPLRHIGLGCILIICSWKLGQR